MSKIEIELNEDGIREMLRSEEISSVCKELADAAAARAGEGYVVEQRRYPERTGYAISPETKEARLDNLKHNTLLKVLGI